MFLRVDQDGRIEEILDVHQKFADLYPEHIWVDETYVSFDGDYVVDGKVTARPEHPDYIIPEDNIITADGIEEFVISGIPPGTRIRVEGGIFAEWVEDSGSCEITVDMPGRYRVTLESWPCEPDEVSFNAT